MGIFRARVTVSNSKEPVRHLEEQFWVDTGTLYSFISEDYLEKIGVEPTGTRNLILADGRQDMRLFGFCDFQVESLMGRIPCPVVFAPRGRSSCWERQPWNILASRPIPSRRS